MFRKIMSIFGKKSASTDAPTDAAAATETANTTEAIESVYADHPEACVIACYYNPKKSEYRKKGFDAFYSKIKNVNHRIIECSISGSEFELEESANVIRVSTDSLLWHKESLLNKVIRELPSEIKYVFWVDADILFTNLNWVVEGAEKLANECTILQPFEFCVHLEKDELSPSVNIEKGKADCLENVKLSRADRRVWRSFAANYESKRNWEDNDYDIHGHVGFAWGMRRDLLDVVGGLYDRALIGGADHIMAHAAVNQIPHQCITKAFVDPEDLKVITEWSQRFYEATQGKLGCVAGDVYHVWHGDLKDREYLKRIQEFSPMVVEIVEKDENGLYIVQSNPAAEYTEKYFDKREVKKVEKNEDKNDKDSSDNNSDKEQKEEGCSGCGCGGYYETN